MGNKKEFGEGFIFTFSNYLWWFFLGSFYFLLLNIPLILTLLVAGSQPDGAFMMILLSSIPVGPALTALLSVMGRIIRTDGTNLTRDFFKAYKTNFIQSLLVWICELAFIFVLYVDIRFFAVKLPAMKYFFYFAAIFMFVVGLYVYPIISRFYMKTKNILKLSFYYSIRNIKTTVICFGLIVLYAVMLLRLPSIIPLFLISLVCYCIMYLEKGVLTEIEGKIEPEPEKITDNK